MYRGGLDLEGIVDNSYAFLADMPGGGDTMPRNRNNTVVYAKPKFNSVREIPHYDVPRTREKKRDPFVGGNWVDTRNLNNRDKSQYASVDQSRYRKNDDDAFWETAGSYEPYPDDEGELWDDPRTLRDYNQHVSYDEPRGSYLLERTRNMQIEHRNHNSVGPSYLLERTNHYLDAIDRMNYAPVEEKPKKVPPPLPKRASIPVPNAKRPSIIPVTAAPPPPPMPTADTLRNLAMPESESAPFAEIKPAKSKYSTVSSIVPGLEDIQNARMNLRPRDQWTNVPKKKVGSEEYRNELQRALDSKLKILQRWENDAFKPPVLEAHQTADAAGLTNDDKYKTIKTLPKNALKNKLNGLLLIGPQKPSFRGGQVMEEKRHKVAQQFLSNKNETYTVTEPDDAPKPDQQSPAKMNITEVTNNR